MRWVRYSCEFGAIDTMLRKLKTDFVRGEGKLHHVIVDGHAAKRKRRGESDAQAEAHPVQTLLS